MYVTLKQLAEEFGMDRSSCRKYVLRQGIEPKKCRTPDSGNQKTLVLTQEQADFVRECRRNEFLPEEAANHPVQFPCADRDAVVAALALVREAHGMVGKADDLTLTFLCPEFDAARGNILRLKEALEDLLDAAPTPKR